VYEDAEGAVHVSYDKFVPIMAPLGIPDLDKVAKAIGALAKTYQTEPTWPNRQNLGPPSIPAPNNPKP
jgi:hypothetical protein